MEKHPILSGIVQFQSTDYQRNKEHFQGLSRRQNPHTLFIGCSDSRVVPNLIISAMPGDLFVVRNIANIVPRYRLAAEYVATTSAIEYAIEVLKVDNIIVCGHSNCGGCQALWQQEALAQVPNVKKWLELAEPVKEKVSRHFENRPMDLAEREWVTEQYNVIEQAGHLLSYPTIAKRIAENSLKIYPLHYIIESGEVYIYDSASSAFLAVSSFNNIG